MIAEGTESPVGIFGHSQGGWVTIEAAGRGAPIAFAVTSSGPGLTPAAQERYSASRALEQAGVSPERMDHAMRDFDAIVSMLREGVSLDGARARVEAAGLGDAFNELDMPFLPNDPAEWDLVRALFDYDPRPALERIRVPLLALFGGDDAVVPVEESVAVYREAVRSGLLTVAVFEGADHRVQTGDPPRPAEGYLETVSSFVAASAGVS